MHPPASSRKLVTGRGSRKSVPQSTCGRNPQVAEGLAACLPVFYATRAGKRVFTYVSNLEPCFRELQGNVAPLKMPVRVSRENAHIH